MVGPQTWGRIPRGLSDLKLAKIIAGAPDTTKVDLPGAQSLTFKQEAETADLWGDDVLLAVAADAPKLSGSIKNALVDGAAYAVLTGGTFGVSGTTPAQIAKLDVPSTPNTTYLQIEGQSNANDGGALRATIFAAMVKSGPDITLATKAFSEPTFDWEAKDLGGKLYKLEGYETAAAIS